MNRLNPKKLHVTFSANISEHEYSLPRRYTLTHSDTTGDLFLTISDDYDQKQVSGWYTRLMRDEVLAELREEGEGVCLHIFCHVSGGIVLGTAGWRNEILKSHMDLVIEALRFGDKELVQSFPLLDETKVLVHFASEQSKYNRVENWGMFGDFA